MATPYKSHSGYFSRAFGNLDDIASKMLEKVESVEFDTMVGTGLSGTLVVPTLARAFGTYWAIVRKEHSPHTSNLIEGEIGQKWLFVDDLICSGETRRRVKDVISGLKVRNPEDYYDVHPIQTEYVGSYLYEQNTYDPF